MPPAVFAQMRMVYGISPEATAGATARAAAILRMMADRLRAQSRRDSPYLVGDGLTAADIYWACFSAMLSPPANDVVAMEGWVRDAYRQIGPELEDALDPCLMEHRDMVFSRHLRG